MISLEEVLQNRGATLHPLTLDPVEFKDGYAVSLYGHEMKISLDKLDEIKFRKILQSYQPLAAENRDCFIGLWVEDGFLYFDLSVHVKNRDEAIKFAEKHHQKAIFDFANMETIYIRR